MLIGNQQKMGAPCRASCPARSPVLWPPSTRLVLCSQQAVDSCFVHLKCLPSNDHVQNLKELMVNSCIVTWFIGCGFYKTRYISISGCVANAVGSDMETSAFGGQRQLPGSSPSPCPCCALGAALSTPMSSAEVPGSRSSWGLQGVLRIQCFAQISTVWQSLSCSVIMP